MSEFFFITQIKEQSNIKVWVENQFQKSDNNKLITVLESQTYIHFIEAHIQNFFHKLSHIKYINII